MDQGSLGRSTLGRRHCEARSKAGGRGAGFVRIVAACWLLGLGATSVLAAPQIDLSRLKGFEGEIKRLVEHVRPSVVGVHVFSRKFPQSDPAEDAGLAGEGPTTSATFEKTTLVIVSGMVRSAEGQIVTLLPNDLIELVQVPDTPDRDIEIEVTLSNGEIYPADWIASDDVTGITLLKARDVQRLQPIRAPKLELEANQFVVGVGNSYGLGDSVSLGFVSSTSRRGECERFVFPRMIQSSVAANPGDLGGMLANTEGAAVGMIAFSYAETEVGVPAEVRGKEQRARATQGEKVNLAIPYDLLTRISAQLEEAGRYRRGSLGMHALLVTRSDMVQLGLANFGVMVKKVDPTGTASAAGLQPGDIITNVANRDLRTYEDLNWFHETVEYGEIDSSLRLNVYRGTPQYKGFKIFNVLIGERDDSGSVAQRYAPDRKPKDRPKPGTEPGTDK